MDHYLRKRRLALLLGVLVAVPVALLGVVGNRLARREQEALKQSFDALLSGQLGAYRDRLGRELAQLESELADELAALIVEEPLAQAGFSQRAQRAMPAGSVIDLDPADLREATRRSARARQIFAIDPAGELIHPRHGASLTGPEEEFLARTATIWKDRDLLAQEPPAEGTSRKKSAAPSDRGWYVWYWGSGACFIFWTRLPDGGVIGAEIDRTRLLSELISAFPLAPPEEGKAGFEKRIRLVDSRGAPLHLWGRWSAPAGAAPRVKVALSPPLHGWNLEYLVPDDAFVASSSPLGSWPLWTSLAGVTSILLLVALSLFREFGREAREAEQRVSFVNRVSHELKTPLTSIRMYAELLEEALADEEGAARKHAGIIVSESQRLSRLIGNVLTFAKKDRGKLGFHPAPVILDQVVDKVLAQFSPSLASKSIRIEVEHGAPGRVRADSDLVIQVLANLITNVEKYASQGGLLRIRTVQESGTTRIVVIDRGPGIRADQREKVFEPFHRGAAGERLEEDSSGTGIGLSIVRDLARLHGGEAWIEPSPDGTVFHVTLGTPPAAEGEG